MDASEIEQRIALLFDRQPDMSGRQINRLHGEQRRMVEDLADEIAAELDDWEQAAKAEAGERRRLTEENARLREALISFPTMIFSIAEAREQNYPELVAYGEAMLEWLSKHKATRDAAMAKASA